MSKKLTDKHIQVINNLDLETQLEILHICAENLGLISVEEYCDATGANRRTVYDHLEKGKITFFEISGKKFPLINK